MEMVLLQQRDIPAEAEGGVWKWKWWKITTGGSPLQDSNLQQS